MKTKVLSLIFLLFVCSLYCQEMPVPQMQKMMTRGMENEALLRLINELEITDQQLPQFISKFREMADLFRHQRENRDKIIQQLERLISGKESDEKIENKISELENYCDRAYEDFKKFRNDMKVILNPQQQAKFILIIDDIRNMLMNFQAVPGMQFQRIQPAIQRPVELPRQDFIPVQLRTPPDR